MTATTKVFAAIGLLVLLAVTQGCGRYVGHVYGTTTGKEYTAPDICKAVAACKAAGEKQCLYAHTTEFSCSDGAKQ